MKSFELGTKLDEKHPRYDPRHISRYQGEGVVDSATENDGRVTVHCKCDGEYSSGSGRHWYVRLTALA